MVLCSSREDPKEVEPLAAPEGSQPGDKVETISAEDVKFTIYRAIE